MNHNINTMFSFHFISEQESCKVRWGWVGGGLFAEVDEQVAQLNWIVRLVRKGWYGCRRHWIFTSHKFGCIMDESTEAMSIWGRGC